MRSFKKTIYFPLPSRERRAEAETGLNLRRRAQAAPRQSKLVSCTETISYYLHKAFSLQRICDLLRRLHNVEVVKSTLSRFIRSNPFLIKQATQKLPINQPPADPQNNQ